MKDGKIVGRAPVHLSRAYWKFQDEGGRIMCEVTGKRKLGKGLEVPCVYKFYGSDRLIQELRKATENLTQS